MTHVPSFPRRRALIAASAIAASAVAFSTATPAFAQAWPAKPSP